MPDGRISAKRTMILTVIAMSAFAANSVLTRAALAPDLIDATAFAAVRVAAGAAMIWVIMVLRGVHRTLRPPRIGWIATALLAYLIGFSFAYRSLDTGTGAVILFGTVQITILLAAMLSGDRLAVLGWTGLAIAFGGVVFLVAPGVTAPDPLGAILMVTAGIGWGAYTLLGRRAASPLITTGWAFLLATPPLLVLGLVTLDTGNWTGLGVLFALLSGAVASGLGYVIWYAALPGLSSDRAAAVQLSVPALAAIAGVVMLSEPLTDRLIIATLATLGGIGLVIAQKRH